jgi:deferrochelatase/peroxidase EfeB
MSLSPKQRANIQGLILRGYSHPYSCHLLFSFKDPKKAPGFFKALYPDITSATDWGDKPPEHLLNIALTFEGLKVLGVLNPEDADQFPAEFKRGPRAGDLGDVGPSAPQNWWGGAFDNSQIHCVVHTYALTPEGLATQVAKVTAAAEQFGAAELLPLREGNTSRRLEGYEDPDGIVHFGYRDGISNPDLDDNENSVEPSALNSFLIGYSSKSASNPGPVAGKALEFAKDGCYVAFRIIEQDVATFENFLTLQAELVYQRLGLTLADAREWIAAKLMGRWRNGSPLMVSPDRPDEATRDANRFDYVEADDPSATKDIQSSVRCPFSAHIRVTNPRKQQIDATQSPPPPRLLRRGMPYGPPLTSKTDDGRARGLVGLFLCGSLTRQFEMIMDWIKQNDFSHVYGPDFNTQDGIMGNRDTSQGTVDATYTIPMAGSDGKGSGEPVCLKGLSSFVTTRGTAYTLLPSLEAIQRLANLTS